MLSKDVVLIMQIINDIRQERPNDNPILKLNKRLKQKSLNKKFNTHAKESMAF